MKKIILLAIVSAVMCACNLLDRKQDDYIPRDAVYGNEKLATAVIANFYGRVYYGQNIDNDRLYIYLDEACLSSGSPDNSYGFSNSFMRVYDYALIREMNEFLAGIRSSADDGLGSALRVQFEGEVRFLRAWVYFNMARTLGGMPIVGDRVFEYQAGMNVADLQLPRSTESEIYDYIIDECSDVADNFLGAAPTVNSARVNCWTAIALKARAAIYAASIARYNASMANPVTTPASEVGIPSSKAAAYYDTALAAAEQIIGGGVYQLYDKTADRRQNFYEATSQKDGNTEVMWAFDHVYPGSTTMFSANNVPTSAAEDESSTNVTPILNLVEAFEYINNRDGRLRTETGGGYIIYNNAEDLFAGKDPRLWGTVIYPGAEFKGEQVIFQAGRITPAAGEWTKQVGAAGSTDPLTGETITSINGPIVTNDGQRNKSGFCIRKFIDESSKASTRRGSAMWFVNFRYAEVLMIACEAAYELGDVPTALDYINEIRVRAGIQKLTTLDFDDIVRERRVEFAFENHRYWDLKRWRMAHIIWDGNESNPDAVHYALFPYRINDPLSPDNGKWVFEKQRVHMSVYPRYFELRNYYNFLDQTWLNNNPLLVKNPYQ